MSSKSSISISPEVDVACRSECSSAHKHTFDHKSSGKMKNIQHYNLNKNS